MTTISKVFIDKLELETFIGLHDWEKSARQNVIADIEIGVLMLEAAEKDDISKSVDYEKLATHLYTWAKQHRCELLEKFAYAIVTEIKSKFNNITNIKLKLTKKGVVPHTEGCGVILEIKI
ncbi:MAG: dihydroneopterin aldolase [Pseudomonadota bacterium]|nr:dihydroneopterin aldolase [Pseudomonadota bacterium]